MYFIMAYGRVILILYFPKYHIQMSSHWKLLAEKSKDSDSVYSSKPQKYTPRKVKRDQQSPSRFHNQTLDRINNSMMSDQKQRPLGRSFIVKTNQPEHLQQKDKQKDRDRDRRLKSSSSQVKLHKQKQMIGPNVTKQMRSTLISYGSFYLNPNQMRAFQSQRNSLVKGEKGKGGNGVWDQLQKLKKQFGVFQSIILRQLQRQQKMINQMFQQILQKLKQQPEQPSPTPNSPTKSNLNPKQQTIFSQTKQILKKYSTQDIHHIHRNTLDIDIDINKDEKKKIRNIQINYDTKSQCRDRDSRVNDGGGRSFSRFFQAMENLKKDIRELNLISDISSVGSPKSEKKYYRWQNVDIAKNY